MKTAPRRTFVTELEGTVTSIVAARRETRDCRSVLVAITGIDGCGKGYVSQLLNQRLMHHGLRTAVINIDGWLNLPHTRFNAGNPAEHFYLHAIRFNDLFDQLVVPLRDNRSVRLEADFAEETASEYRKYVYEFVDIDVILIEGIYLLKRAFRHHYDLSFWIDCSFETALERAIARAQEGLSPEATVAAYRTVYFPAQMLHFARDDPRAHSEIIPNDSATGVVPAGASVANESLR